jgi:site-specific DNA-methyltransferase (adenine-specific)
MTEIQVGEVAMIPIEKIVVGERARQDMGDLVDLENSLKKSGLIQPLAVQRKANSYLLLAGERRYTVLLMNEVSPVPVRIYNEDLTDLELKVIERAENFYRKDMEYWEYDALVAEIHTLQQSLVGISAPGPGHDKGHTLKDTANMFGITDVSVSTAIKRNEVREMFPDLFNNCKTQKDATNLIKKMDEAVIKESIAKKLEAQKGSTKLIKLADAYIQGDFFAGVKKIPDRVIHLVEIDPPYAIKLQQAKKKDGESQYDEASYNEVDVEDYQKFISKVFAECYRVMSDHSWLLCWFAPEPWFEVIYRELNNAGFQTTRMCGIWTKPSGQSKHPESRLANAYEMFFYAWKGQPALNKAGRSNIFNYSPVPPTQKTHPTERPVELMQEIYDTFAFTGSRILIPFLGSGSGLVAADNLGISGLGFELSKSYRDSFIVKVNGMR